MNYLRLDVIADHHSPYCGRQYEVEFALYYLLVMRHRCDDIAWLEVVNAWQFSQSSDPVFDSQGIRMLDYPDFLRDCRCALHPITNCFAMLQPAKARRRLQRMADSVAKIQDSSQTRFTLVCRNYIGLDLTASGDQMRHRHRLEVVDPIEILS